MLDSNGAPVAGKDGNPQVRHFALVREFRLFNVALYEGLPAAFLSR
ncbi:hypothetical protein [Salmonella bongori]|uniref:Uncharacterized protein n=1 Tax=Salmonella bongori TaxID=54736 RepID=A0A698WEF1_SALBN|nr:hypothetical protein [Salmonella bongori]EDP8664778.1 hypothetical protein [Salmonella bongori]EGE4656922.1 hypothetical protein [Salmonella bongori serovar 40:z35:- str. 95-0123]